jgi:phosphoribosylformylglycinamidine synthase
MRAAVVVFPGSTCDVDCHRAVDTVLGVPVDDVPHTATDLSRYDLIVVPGGFSYGDYLRAGAIARFAPVMAALRAAAERGAYVLGICNGFQILLEAGLLEGAMRRNDGLAFRCHQTELSVVNAGTPFTGRYAAGETIRVPIAHGEGNWYCDDGTLARLRDANQIVFTYVGENPNGSVADVAGICNPAGNVLGMMPHPERAIDVRLGSADGVRLFRSVLDAWRERHGAAVAR